MAVVQAGRRLSRKQRAALQHADYGRDMDAVLLWALPDDWIQFELLAPEVADSLDTDMRRRFEGSGVDEEALDSLIAAQLEGFEAAAGDGVVLIAATARKQAGPGDPPPGLSLTLAVGNLPPPAQEGTAAGIRSPEATSFVSSALPLRLSDSDMSGFIREARAEVTLPGIETPLQRFQVQAFVFPAGQPGFMTVTVTTFDPSLEDDARSTARGFADTLTFVVAEDEGET